VTRLILVVWIVEEVIQIGCDEKGLCLVQENAVDKVTVLYNLYMIQYFTLVGDRDNLATGLDCRLVLLASEDLLILQTRIAGNRGNSDLYDK
jgi:hypothetical protein